MREAKKPSFVRLDQRSNEELKTQTRHLCEVNIIAFCSFVNGSAHCSGCMVYGPSAMAAT